MLSPKEMQRYARHLPIIGLEGQQKLRQAKVLCIGAGGLGSPVLHYLAAAGIGTLGIVDDDCVELSNLQRQILYQESDVHLPKVLAAKQRLTQQNPNINIIAIQKRLENTNAAELIAPYDVIIDGSDNYQTRYLINDICYQYKKPLIFASIFQFQGQCSVFNYQNGPCYRCLYSFPPPKELMPNCTEGGVMGAVPGIIGSIQSIETIKILLKQGEILSGRLLIFDALAMDFKEYLIHKDPDCRLCRHGELSHPLFQDNSSVICNTDIPQISPHELKSLLAEQDVILLDVREPYEREIYSLGGEHIPLAHLNPAELNWSKQTKIIIYCKSGARSQKAVRQLQRAGFVNVSSLKGGVSAWTKIEAF